jgi:hypothetical protein
MVEQVIGTASMSQQAFEQFRELVLDDDALQAQLRPGRNLSEFLPVALKLARERGIDIDADDVQTAWQAAQRAWIVRWI